MSIPRIPKPPLQKQDKRKVTVGVQSVYRESDTQTDPWTPKYRVVNGKPEVLALGFMKIQRDLPAWRRTVDAIEFMRKRRAWERYLANIYSPENAKYCKRIIMDIEECERRLIEADFDKRNHKRLELAKREAQYFDYTMDQRFREREQFVAAQIAKKKEDKLWSIKAKQTRELRKIDMKQRGVNMKYHHLTPIEEMCDPLSPFHVSVARFGKNPRYATQVLDPECTIVNMKAFRAVSNLLEDRANIQKPASVTTRPKKHDCSIIKEVDPDGNDAVHLVESSSAEKMHLQIESEGAELEEFCKVPLFPSPHQEKDYQAVLLIQTLIRGRAVQNLMYKGRKRNQATIDEIQSTVAFFKEEEDEVDFRRRRALQRLRYYHLNMKLIGLVALVQQEILGLGIAELALKAHHEVERITEEQRGYLMALLAERTRWHREAAEAGRRQRELRRRELYDEFFKHITRRNEITTEFYVKLIQRKVVRDMAEKEADLTTRQRADEIEKQDIKDAKRKKHDIVTRREAMARLLHDFYLPQIGKNLERYSMDYYIGKARKTAIDVITDGAKKYGARGEETTLLEPVKRSKGVVYEPCTPPSTSLEDTLPSDSSSKVVPDDEPQEDGDDDFAEKIAFLESFMKQETMSVMDDAEKVGKEAEYYKNKIISRLRAQEEERRHTLMMEQMKFKSATDQDACYENLYKYDQVGSARRKRTTNLEDPDVAVDENEEEVGEEGAVDDESASQESKGLSFSDYVDMRLLVDSDAQSTTASESDEDGGLKYYGDMPDRFIDELLIQGQVLEQIGHEKVDLATAALEPETHSLDSFGSSGVIGASDGKEDAEESAKPEYEIGEEVEDEQLLVMAQRKYAQWRDASDMSRLDWGYKQATPSEGSEEGLLEGYEYDEGVEGDEETYSYFNYDHPTDDEEAVDEQEENE